MIRIFDRSTTFISLFFLLITCNVVSQETEAILNDGPYVFIENHNLVQKDIVNGKVVTKKLKTDTYDIVYEAQKSVFTNVEKIAAFSDIHGQYDLAIEILQNNKIIDEDLNWNFGKGHLVIVGDVFDRGDKVNEMLWFIYGLEQQANKNGGHLHYLLGNHEYMVLHKDLRYIHKKYEAVSQLLELDYDQLYGKNTVLGRWLRAKSTIVKINDNTFVHGGISKIFLKEIDFDIDAINNTMRTSIDRSKSEMKSTDFYSNYYGSNGPIWYRGYFNDDLPDKEIADILESIASKHIVVGHCSFKEVISVYDNRIFGVDSSIKNGEYGEVLFIMNNDFIRGKQDGTTTSLKNKS